jgi:hypothetical protein
VAVPAVLNKKFVTDKQEVSKPLVATGILNIAWLLNPADITALVGWVTDKP